VKNKLTDLNDHLFMAIERLNSEELGGEKLSEEIDRCKAMAQVANTIIDNGKLMLEAAEFNRGYQGKAVNSMRLLTE
jgi:hypothetical protein